MAARCDVTTWFTKEVLWWRTVAAIAWFWIASPLVLLALAACLSFSLTHPVAYISDLFSLLLTLTFWGSWLLCSLLFTLVGQLHKHTISVDDEPHAGPLVAVLRLFYPVPRLVRHIVYGTASFLLSAMCTFFYQSLPSASQPLVSRWYVACNSSPGICMSGDFMLICVNSALVGAFYSISSLASKEHRLVFPPFQQGRYFRVRAVLPSCLRKAVVLAGKVTVACFLIYLVCGQIVFSFFRDMFAASWLNSPSSLFSVWSFTSTWHFFFTMTFILFCHYLVAQLFLISISQPVTLVVQSSLTADNERLLSKALKSRDRTLQYLAYQDFCSLSNDESRRKPVFSLAASGRAEVWQNLSDECLLLIRTLTSTLQNSLLPKEERPAADTSTTNSSSAVPNAAVLSPNNPASGFVSKPGWPTLAPAPTASSLVRRPQNVGAEMWSKSPVARGVEDVAPSQAAPTKNTALNVTSTLSPWASLRLSVQNYFLNTGKPKPSFKLINGTLSMEERLRASYVESQKHIWAVEGICALVVASYSEDKYGVVQKSFSDILNSLLELLRAVESTLPNPPSVTVSGRNISINVQPPSGHIFGSVHPLQLALVSTLQTGIYRVSCVFREHLHNFSITPDNQQRLAPFLQFWE